MRVAAFTRYGRQAASTRQRLLQYIPALREAGIEVESQALLSDDYVRSLATRGLLSPLAFSPLGVARGYYERLRSLLFGTRVDLIWVYAELFPYLPAQFEKLALKKGCPVVYDFDDAFFHGYDASPNPLVRKLLGRKLEPLLRGAAACTCGNAYLRDYAARFCERSIILPTVVDTGLYTPRAAPPDASKPIVVGWIGSPSTWPYLRPILPVLAELARNRKIEVRVVGAGAQARGESFTGLELVEWNEEAEIAEVQRMDIGIMPVPDDIWARGKSGYKLIQYMACGLPVVASPVGVNRSIVEHGLNGFLADKEEEWRSALIRLIDDGELRRRFGQTGRARAVGHYSLETHAPRLVELLKSVTAEVAPFRETAS
jgi:glycosyltransferase involved in cell wall biosynthesis